MRVLSYNIHKGFSATNLNFVLSRIKSSIEEVQADLVLLQEVVGHHEAPSARIPDWPTASQFEYLADGIWSHFAYGKNSVYTDGHHGNAILSKYPISSWENEDVSPNRLERRGLLHATIQVPDHPEPFHLICVHLGLFERHRRSQVGRLCRRIASLVPASSPVIVGGDFNDWRGRASAELKAELGLEEAFLASNGLHARTFPSWFPFLRLDRMYFRGLRCSSARLAQGGVWSDLSDHLPIVADFSI